MTKPASPRRRNSYAAATLTGLLVVTGGVGASAAGSEVSANPPAQAGPDSTVSWAERTLRDMTLEQKVGQLFVADVWGQAPNEKHAGNQEKYGVDTPSDVVRKYQPGGVIYFNHGGTDNIERPKQVAKLSNGLQRAALATDSGVPLIVSVDQEGGRVTRVGEPATEQPSPMALGAGRDTEAAKATAAVTGSELRAMGINQDFAPVADVNSNPANPIIGSRSFSADPQLASDFVSAQVHGYQDSGSDTATVSSSAKHFPGHGDAATDSHTSLPTIDRTEQEWREIDLPPFKAAVDAGIDSIMTAHIRVPSLDPSGEPATLSKPIMTGLLREELGYDGVVVTDSLQMQGVREMHPDSEIPVLALEAGVDQMLMPPDLDVAVNGVLDAVNNGRITEERIDKSVLRILELKAERGIPEAPMVNVGAVDKKVGTPANRETVQAATDKAPTLLRNDDEVLPLTGQGKTLVTGWNNLDYPGYPARPVESLASKLGDSATALPTGAEPDEATIRRAVNAAGDADTVVVLTNGLSGDAAQRDLLHELLATDANVVAVSVQEPYDPGYVDVPTWLATYDWRDVSMTSLAQVLLGQQAPQGKLPVTIPAGDDPDTTRYPFGHGLTW
ncbi:MULTISPECIES: glycoside hydrolase family 3 protein [Prauserella salsuginis group]|uniref:beta-N-acetylhexosaminidase n=2 Tax=Prauserella salsuginis group TaxID=2893672 RepID=A0A839XTV2_9PSEU|nr:MULTISPECIES: glycoside hydrolase family 3 protein [Prauserella salsuginis group]MBB3663275.1 beta-N-acetylhexosaminidase [Prauserella sediminis]MCR3720898.1 beta-N-acetylhexosaminidase [Prauserella flava]MCR3735021.1 beta-N-acetylhexosaminidase [Prauserella salsuginis]